MGVRVIGTPATTATDSFFRGKRQRGGYVFRLESFAGRATFLAVLAVVAAAYSAVSLRAWWAAHLAEQSRIPQLEQAVRVGFGNAEYHARLGRQYLLTEQDANRARAEFQAAAVLNPHAGAYWLDLAKAYNVLDNAPAERDAVERAVQAEPTSLDVLWDAAGHLLVMGDTTRSMHMMRSVMQYRPDASYRGLELLWRSVADVDLILADAVPATPDVHLAFIRLLMRRDQPAAASRVWKHLVSLGKPVPTTAALFYFDYLIERRQPEQAHSAWTDLSRLDSMAAPDGKQLVTNGDFERTPIDGGFDWRLPGNDAVVLSMNSDVAHSGTRSAKFLFEGEISGDVGLKQYVVLQPNTAYVFRTYVKTDNLRGASMPAFVLVDAYSPSRIYLTVAVPDGSREWSLVEQQFQTGPEARLGVLTFRAQGRRVVLGELWIDDMSIIRR